MRSKKAQGIGISIIVVIILSLIASTMLFMFFVKSKRTTEKLTGEIEAGFREALIQQMTDTTQKVILPIFKKKIKRGQSYTFPLGIHNVLESNEEINFYVKIEGDGFDVKTWTYEEIGPYVLKEDDKQIVKITIRVPSTAKRGAEYKFKINVFCDIVSGIPESLCNPYGYQQEIIIQVK